MDEAFLEKCKFYGFYKTDVFIVQKGLFSSKIVFFHDLSSRSIKCEYRGLQGVTGGYKGLRGVREAYSGLQMVTGGYRELQRVIGVLTGYMWLQEIKGE